MLDRLFDEVSRGPADGVSDVTSDVIEEDKVAKLEVFLADGHTVGRLLNDTNFLGVTVSESLPACMSPGVTCS